MLENSKALYANQTEDVDSPFDTLLIEIILEIFKKCNSEELLKLRLVNKKLKTLAEDLLVRRVDDPLAVLFFVYRMQQSIDNLSTRQNVERM